METNRVDYEIALNMTGFSRHNLRTFILCGCIIVGQVFEVYSLFYLVPASACDLQTTTTQQQFMMTLPIFAVLGSGHTLGFLTDTKGRRKVLMRCMMLGFILAVIAVFSPHWIMFCVLKFASAACMGVGHLLSQVLLSECTPKAKRSVMVILSTSILLVSIGLMAVISIPILALSSSFYIPFLNITFNSWRLLSLMYSVPSAIAAIAVSRAFESPQYLFSIGNQGKALEVLRTMYEINTGNSGDDYKVKALVLNEDELKTEHKNYFRSILARTMPIFKSPFRRYTNILSWLYNCSCICFIVIIRWLVFIASSFHTSVANGDTNLTVCGIIRKYQNSTALQQNENCSINNSAMTTVFGVVMILAVLNTVLCGLVKFTGRKKLYISIQFVSGVALLCINFSSHWILNAVLFVIFLTGVINYGVVMSYVIDVYPTYIRASAMSLLILMGFASANSFLGIIMKFFNSYCEYVIYILVAIFCLGGLLGMLLPTDEKILELKKRNDENEEKKEEEMEEEKET